MYIYYLYDIVLVYNLLTRIISTPDQIFSQYYCDSLSTQYYIAYTEEQIKYHNILRNIYNFLHV